MAVRDSVPAERAVSAITAIIMDFSRRTKHVRLNASLHVTHVLDRLWKGVARA